MKSSSFYVDVKVEAGKLYDEAEHGEEEDEDDPWDELTIDEAQCEALKAVAESFEDLMFKMNETCKVHFVNL